MKTIFKFFKTLFKILIWMILILILLVVILYLSAGKIVQYVAPDFISKVTQTETSLGEVDISLFSGHLALNNLNIGNPAGFKDKNAFQLGQLTVDFDPRSVLSDKIVINKVATKGIRVSTELNAKGQTNVTELLNNVNQFVGEGESSAKAPQSKNTVKKTANTSAGPAVVIRDLTIDQSVVRAGIAGQMMEIPLPAIHQQDIGEKKKQTLGEIIVNVLNLINAESTKAVIQATKEALSKNIQLGKDTAKGLTNTLKNLFQ